MNKLDRRRKHYGKTSTNLACLSNKHLLALLAKPMHEGIGGTSVLISIEGSTPVLKLKNIMEISL